MATIKKLLVALGLDKSEYDEGLDEANKKAGASAASIGQSLAGIGGKAILAGTIAGVTAVSGAMVAGLEAVNDWAGTLDSLGDVLGTNAGESAALAVAIQGVGGNVGAITSQMAFLTRGLEGANGALGPTGQALKDLGVAFMDANGNILPATDILAGVADKLAAMPDGLEKTAIMTDLFGKSGKDLTDVMNALANGGLDEAAKKAKTLGLALSDDMVAASVEAGKQMETLKMTAQGFFVSIGAKLLPIVVDLMKRFNSWATGIMPKVLAGIDNVAGFVQLVLIPAIGEFLEVLKPAGNFMKDFGDTILVGVNTAILYVARFIRGVLIPAFQFIMKAIKPIANFLLNNWQPILAGVVTVVMGFLIPAFIAWATSAWAAASATITALAPVIVPILAIGAAVALLVAAWQNNWGGIRDKLTEVWGIIQPIFNTFKTWLETNIPKAIEVLRGFWENTLWPAIKRVWAWMQDTLFPFLGSLAELVSAVLGKALEGLAGVWENILKPALTGMWNFFNDNILPVLKDVTTWLSEKLKPAFDGITKAIQTVTGWLSDLAAQIGNLTLPDWLTPGSPTPLEIGLKGIANAMGELNRTQLPEFSSKLQLAPAFAGNPAEPAREHDRQRESLQIIVNIQGGTRQEREHAGMGVTEALRAAGLR